ncbi:heterogeneous nuclear ribonucleoprotein L-like [Penaeus monodon]|uniref:heterogeneous nuclear ribonucleoprotein L-like n=1 Tax=Penaeus monodon TaxID=6687 RepID=UPI0018A7034A|nr:heterogeneous nuclear ribonucleoprotein L-like [Penaeus monodon]
MFQGCGMDTEAGRQKHGDGTADIKNCHTKSGLCVCGRHAHSWLVRSLAALAGDGGGDGGETQRVSRFALGETEPYRGRPHLFGHLRATLRLQPREKTAALGDCGGGVGVGFVVAVAGLVAGGLGIANDVAGIVAATGLYYSYLIHNNGYVSCFNVFLSLPQDVIHTICQPYGNVLRIVIFKKNGVQAMVEFDGIEPATRAREGLQGADIYSGCCTLRIEYAKPTKLNVYKNDAESWDFTNPNVGMKEPQNNGSGGGGGSSRPPLLQEPRGFGMNAAPFRGGMNGQMGGPRNSAGALFNSPMPDRFGMNNGISNGGLRGGGLVGGGGGPGQGGPFMGGAGGPGGASLQAMGQPQPGIPQQGAVLMVYGLNKDKMNADRIFNLLCLYGNVVRIKFLKTKEGCAMVQMGDALAVERAVANLNNTTFFSCKMQLGYSKQAFLADVQQPYDLPDGTPSFKDYMGNKNNRFINPEMASKNRIQPPSKILHFFNTPPGLDEDQLKQVFIDGGVTEPKSIKLFPSKSKCE